jgi:hypothetical protein
MRGATQIWLILVACSNLVTPLVTLDTMRNLTVITEECRERITGGTDGKVGMSMPGQVVLGAGISAGGENGDDSDEIEDVSLFRFDLD